MKYSSVINVAQELSASPVTIDTLDTNVSNSALINIRRQYSSQNLYSNDFGDRVGSVYFSRPESVGSAAEQQAVLNTILVSDHQQAFLVQVVRTC